MTTSRSDGAEVEGLDVGRGVETEGRCGGIRYSHRVFDITYGALSGCNSVLLPARLASAAVYYYWLQ